MKSKLLTLTILTTVFSMNKQRVQAQELVHDLIGYDMMIEQLNNHVQEYLETPDLQKYQLQINRQESFALLVYDKSILFFGTLGVLPITIFGAEVMDSVMNSLFRLDISISDSIMDDLFHNYEFYFTLTSPLISEGKTIPGFVLVKFSYNESSHSLAFNIRDFEVNSFLLPKLRSVSGSDFEIFSDPNFFAEDPTTGLITTGVMPLDL